MKYLFGILITIFMHAPVFGELLIRKIKPSDTNPLIKTFDEDSNYVYLNKSIPPKNILLIHLPGSYGEPKRATLFGSLAANLGFHSIGLMYPNIPTVGSICARSTDKNCYEMVRREIIEGVDFSPDIQIDSNECILNRVSKLLTYLKQNDQGEGWEQFIDSHGKLIFEKIIFSGHSQGGGHAALIGKYYSLKRVLCFSSPKDWSVQFNEPASWVSNPAWKTPLKAFYCFNHTLDEYERQKIIWDSLGIEKKTDPINIDSALAPFSNRHLLATSYPVAVGDEHASTIQDNKTPKLANNPVFIPVWTYMLTQDLTPSSVANRSFKLFHEYPNIMPFEIDADLTGRKIQKAKHQHLVFSRK